MKKRILPFFILFISVISISQETVEVTGNITSKAFLGTDVLPFWAFTNTNGFLSENSEVGVLAFAKAQYNFSPTDSLRIGLGTVARDGFRENVQRGDLYLEYANKWFKITAGAKSVEPTKNGLSTINNNILWTGNTRAIPGVEVVSKTIPLGKKLDIAAEFGHYRLNDERGTKDTNIHYKRLTLGWNFSNKSALHVGLRHYAQWAGTTADGQKLPSSFKDYLRVFSGQNGVGIDNPNETINALGNHLGSYEISYDLDKENIHYSLYHNSLFEDRSGRELNNFPDGVWGLYIIPKKYKWIKGILYEYVQTVSQSGSPRATIGLNQQSGGDNYFVNSVYTSGWTYEGTTIGLPFVDPTRVNGRAFNNRSIAHHLGVNGCFGKINFQTKLTYLINLGTYATPFPEREKKILSYLELGYDTEKYGSFNTIIGADTSNINDNAFAIGVGYKYQLK